jgi:hypothetical protein
LKGDIVKIITGTLLPLLLLLLGSSVFSADSPTPPKAEEKTSKVAKVNPKEVEVWITRTGKKYHRSTCQYAKIKSNLEEAQSKGLTPCKVCNP